LAQRAESLDLSGARIYVANSPFGGFRVRIVHDAFAGKSDSERQHLLFNGLSIRLDTCELVTTSEEEWYGPPFLEDEDNLPAWPEALRRKPLDHAVTFASDLDIEIDRPVVVTFYSLRG